MSFLCAEISYANEIVVRGNIQDWNLLMECLKKSNIEHWKAIKAEDFLYNQITPQLDSTIKK